MNKSENKNVFAPPPRVVVTDFAQLNALFTKPVPCVFYLDGQEIELPVQRISPGLAEQVRKLRRTVMPPFRKDRNPPAGDYDQMDPKYLAERDAVELKIRALIVYASCPILSSQKPGLTVPDEMLSFVQGLLSENVLDLIMLTAQAGGMHLASDEEVQRRANFTYTPDSAS